MHFILLLICISCITCVNCYGYCRNEYINVVGKDGTKYTILTQEYHANRDNMLHILKMCMQKQNDVNPNRYYIIKDIEQFGYHIRQQFIEEYRKSYESNEDFNCSEVIHTYKKIHFSESKDPVGDIFMFILALVLLIGLCCHKCITIRNS